MEGQDPGQQTTPQDFQVIPSWIQRMGTGGGGDGGSEGHGGDGGGGKGGSESVGW